MKKINKKKSLSKKPSSILWKTKEGLEIPINLLKNDHLLNIIRLLERKAQDRIFEIPFPNFQGELAQMCAENEYFAEIEDCDPQDYFPEYNDLVKEAEKRKLL